MVKVLSLPFALAFTIMVTTERSAKAPGKRSAEKSVSESAGFKRGAGKCRKVHRVPHLRGNNISIFLCIPTRSRPLVSGTLPGAGLGPACRWLGTLPGAGR